MPDKEDGNLSKGAKLLIRLASMFLELAGANVAQGDSGVAKSVEMGVEMFRVEWGKPPGPQKTYGR